MSLDPPTLDPLLSKTAPRIFPIFRSVEDNRAHFLSLMVFLKKFFVRNLREVTKKGVFLLFLAFSPKRL